MKVLQHLILEGGEGSLFVKLDDKGIEEPVTAQRQRGIAFGETNWKKDFFAGLSNKNCNLV